MSEKQGIPPPAPYVAGAPPSYGNLYPAPPTYVPDAPPMEHFQPEHQKVMPTAVGAATERHVEPPPPMAVEANKGSTQQHSGLTGALSSIANDIGRGIDSVARVVQGATGIDVLHWLANGAVIQLANPKTRSTLEIVVSPHTGYLMVDCRGPVDRAAGHAHWSVVREHNTGNVVRLHNRDNYLGVVNGELTLIQAASVKEAPMSTRFRVRQASGQLCFESLVKPAHYLVVEPSDLSIKLKEVYSINANSYFLLYIVETR